MGNPKVIVTVTDDHIKVNVSSNTPSVINATDHSIGITKVVVVNPAVTVRVGVKPVVNVKYGTARQYDPSGILALILAGITREHLDAVLIAELDGFNTSIADLINQTSLLSADLDITEASLAVSQEDIIANVLSIAANEGNLDIAVSNITQNATDIISAVIRISNSEGDISAAQSTIIQNANSITQLVTDLSSSDTLISQNATAITAQATTLNQTNNTLDTAVLELTAQGLTVEVLSTDLDNAEASIGSTMEMLNSQYSVTIEQDGLGNDYVTGLKLIMYPQWAEIHYVVDDYVWFQNSSWKCILDHDADETNYPQAGAPGSTYWTEVAGGIRTSFSILADEFKVQSTVGDEVITPFIINGTSGEIEFNATVKFTGINQTIISGGYINTNLVNANSILANSITAGEIAADTLTATEIAANAITATELSADSVIATKIAADAIETIHVKALNITTAKINDHAVTESGADTLASKTITTGYALAVSVTLEAFGGHPISVSFSSTLAYIENSGELSVELRRGTTVLKTQYFGNAVNLNGFVMEYVDAAPSAGTYTYSAYIKRTGGSSGVIYDPALWVMGLMK